MTVFVVALLAFAAGAAVGGIWVAAVYERRTESDAEQLPARGAAHVDHEPPTPHRAASRFDSRPQVPHQSDGGRS